MERIERLIEGVAEQCWVHGKAAALRNVQTLISEKYKKIKQKERKKRWLPLC